LTKGPPGSTEPPASAGWPDGIFYSQKRENLAFLKVVWQCKKWSGSGINFGIFLALWEKLAYS
jgi:hypothetical protein